MAGREEREFTIEIAASPRDCFQTIVDFDSYPSWSSAIRGARVIEADRSGVGRVVEFRIDAKIKTIRYVLEYSYHKPTELNWHSVDGDVEFIEGSYRFEKAGPKRTAVTCRQAIELGFWVPGPLRRMLEQTALRDSVLEFKNEVERRYGRRF